MSDWVLVSSGSELRPRVTARHHTPGAGSDLCSLTLARDSLMVLLSSQDVGNRQTIGSPFLVGPRNQVFLAQGLWSPWSS